MRQDRPLRHVALRPRAVNKLRQGPAIASDVAGKQCHTRGYRGAARPFVWILHDQGTSREPTHENLARGP